MGQFDGHQLRLVVLGPGGDQRAVDLQGAGAPGLAPGQAHLVAVPGDDACTGIGWLGGPHAPYGITHPVRGATFGQDRQGVGMPLVQFRQ
ncbi:hypothetical protein D3C76_1488130 [compost metagenome]